MTQVLPSETAERWREAARAFRGTFTSSMRMYEAMTAVWGARPEGIECLRNALNSADRPAAIHALRWSDDQALKELFPELIALATFDHPDLAAVRRAIMRIGRPWLLEHIEATARSHLVDGSDEEYRRLLELYAGLDLDLTIRLARDSQRHGNADVREAGEDFLLRAVDVRTAHTMLVQDAGRALDLWLHAEQPGAIPRTVTWSWSSGRGFLSQIAPGDVLFIDRKNIPTGVVRRGLDAAAASYRKTLAWHVPRSSRLMAAVKHA